MYMWIDGEKWDGAGRPAIHEEHGFLVGPDSREFYGRSMSEVEARVIASALVEFRYPRQPSLLDAGGASDS